MSDFIKMSDLVDKTFKVEEVGRFVYKFWDNDQRKMLTSETWQSGYNKVYRVTTDKGILDVSASKLGEMLESVSQNGQSSVVGRVFSVKSNGKTGIDIRYYINPAKDTSGIEKAQETYRNIKESVAKKDTVIDDIDESFDLSEIPF
jgi:hypothetical protein